MKKGLLWGLLAAVLCFSSVSEAVQTRLVIRAHSKDAKFVGTSMGGARIVVTDSQTGKVIAEGLTEGGTGDTQKIMIEPRTRYKSIADGAAKFETSIDIDEPKLLTVSAEAPYLHRDNMVRSTTQVWLIPGRDIDGDGLILEIPGFSVDMRSPGTLALEGGNAVIPVEARIVMI
ncbi:MAG: hypothetical protein JSU90_01410 [Nitrospiraceae bacterium]|nr:MAG: hypothetical protein JSU90_01410 [Nitrospiraceae bacterium]